MPFVPSSDAAMPFVPTSDALVPSSFLLLLAMPGAPFVASDRSVRSDARCRLPLTHRSQLSRSLSHRCRRNKEPLGFETSETDYWFQ